MIQSATEGDRASPLTRRVAALLVPFLVAAGAILWIWPDRTAEMFAWTIQPRMTPLLMGAGYLAGAYFFLRVSTSNRWPAVALGFLPVTAFAWVAAAATLMHWDRFNHSHITFLVWAVLYALTPFVVPALWLANRTDGSRDSRSGNPSLPAGVAIGLAAAGLAVVMVGAGLILAPERLMPLWPWALTPLTARMVGAFFIVAGLSDLGIAVVRRWSANRVLLEAQLVGLIFILLGIPRALDSFDPNNPLTAAFISGLSLLFLSLIAIYIFMARRAVPYVKD